VLSPQKTEKLSAHRAAVNSAELAGGIQRLQEELTGLAKRPTLTP